METRINRILKLIAAKIIFRLWPTHIGIGSLMNAINPPYPCYPEGKTIVKKLLRFPLKMKFRTNTVIGRYLYYRGMYEEGTILKLSKLLKIGMTFIDIGANIGLYSVIAACLVGKEGRVVAVEPQSDLCDLFQENIRMNNLTNVILKPVALGKGTGEGTIFQVSATNVGAATLKIRKSESYFGTPVKVSIRSLDQVLKELKIREVHGLKIDTEGAELEILQGFRDWLTNNPPNFIFLECIESNLNRFGHNATELISFLKGYKYRIFCLYRGRWLPIDSSQDLEKLSFPEELLALR